MRLVLCFLFLCATTAVLGQSQPHSSQPQNQIPAFLPPATIDLLRPYGMGCPVGMKAERQASGQREWIVSLEDEQQPQRADVRANKAGVHVELVDSTGNAMKQAEVAVYYMAPEVHSMLVNRAHDQASQASDPTSDNPVQSSSLKKTFVLSAVAGESNLRLAGSLLVGNAASITSVRLLRIEYTDGSIWQTKAGSGCAVAPSLFMTLAGRR